MRYIPYFYFLRVYLIFAILLATLPLTGLSIGEGPNSMIGGFFDLTNSEAFLVCLRTLFYGAASEFRHGSARHFERRA